MPYTDPSKQRAAKKASYERCRDRKRAVEKAEVVAVLESGPAFQSDPASAVAAWAKARLKVPPGHRLAGQAMGFAGFRGIFHS